jgi:hypothetical protein
MIMKKTLIALTILLAAFACKEDKKIIDPVAEYVSLRGAESVNLGEANYNKTGYPLVVQLWATRAYTNDITYTFEITPTNAVADVDFSLITPSNFKILAGNLTDTVWVKTIDNATGTDLPRTIEVKIKSISKNDIGIGLGPQTKANTTVLFSIIDDECSNTTSIYNSSLNNSLNWGYNGHETGTWNETGVALTATGSLSGNKITVAGDLLYYDGFIPGNVYLSFTLTPNSPGATKGKATFGTLDLGVATDGYTYRLLEIGEGTYDVCSKTITTLFDLQWDDGGTWAHYYYVGSTFSLP